MKMIVLIILGIVLLLLIVILIAIKAKKAGNKVEQIEEKEEKCPKTPENENPVPKEEGNFMGNSCSAEGTSMASDVPVDADRPAPDPGSSEPE